MKRNAFFLLAISTVALVAGGCVGTIDNHHVAGNPLVKDKIVRVYERPVLQCWDATKEVLNANGTMLHDDRLQSTLTARVDTRTVIVKVEEIDKKMTRVTTQVRTKWGGSDLDLGGEMDKQIALRLATGQTPVGAPGK